MVERDPLDALSPHDRLMFLDGKRTAADAVLTLRTADVTLSMDKLLELWKSEPYLAPE